MSTLLRSIRQHPSTWFYCCWLLVNLVQAAGTELLHDEAYYWVYSHYPDWGYFDHPPMIALLIKAGYAIFPNELDQPAGTLREIPLDTSSWAQMRRLSGRLHVRLRRYRIHRWRGAG